MIEALDLALSPISPRGTIAFRVGTEEASLIDGVATPGSSRTPTSSSRGDAVGFYHLVVNRQAEGVRIEGDCELLEQLLDGFAPRPARAASRLSTSQARRTSSSVVRAFPTASRRT